MSFGFGDALAAAELVWDVYSSCRDAPEKMRETCSIVDAIRNELEFLAPEVEKAGTNGRDAVPAFFTDLHADMERLTGDLQKLEDLVVRWNEAPLKRPWMIARMSKVDHLRQRLTTYNHTLERKVNYLLLQQVNRAKAQYETAMTGLSAQITQLQLSQNAEGRSSNTTQSVEVASYSSMEPMLEPPETKVARTHRRRSSGRVTPSPGHSPSPSLDNDVSEEIMVTKPEKGIKSILLVDKGNYARSAMSQAFLEMSRVRAANATGRWLFDKVGSAGFGVESDFTQEAFEAGILNEQPMKRDDWSLSKRSLNAIERMLADTKPREYTDILSRLRQVNRRGLTLSHFQYSDSIICFGGVTFRVLLQMRAYAQQKLSEQGLRCRGWISRFNMPYLSEDADDKEIERLFETSQQRMTEFLWTKLDWVAPVKINIVNGPYRTRQILIDRRKADPLKKSIPELTREAGCLLIRVERFSAVKQKGIASIVGRKETLDKAEEVILGFEA
ncbi:MAG: hypothetical protein M1828_005239 [Chrysothrix sp. TS-e1954]|nr:MAG: hypothetical protein M1828_005239 [Chrysothrix sp. TS-e1954]